MKYALIGCGRVAHSHINAAAAAGFDIAAVCDISQQHINSMFACSDVKENGGIRRYSVYTELYEREKPDIVSIALPSGLHAAAAEAALERGINVIIEKPIAMSLEDADRIIELSEKNGLLAAVCHQNRFNAAVQKTKAALDAGRFGMLSHAAVAVRWSRDKAYYDQADWRGKFASDGGALMNQCIHGIDLLCWLCSGRLKRVYGKTLRRFHPYIEAEDAGLAVLEFDNGIAATVEGSVNACERDMEEHLTLFGKNGTVKLGGSCANTVEYWHFAGEPPFSQNCLNENVANVYGNGHCALFKDAGNALLHGTRPYVDAYAGRAALEAVLAVYKSSAGGRPVELPLESCSSADFRGVFGR